MISSAQAGYCSRDSTDVGKHGDLVFGCLRPAPELQSLIVRDAAALGHQQSALNLPSVSPSGCLLCKICKITWELRKRGKRMEGGRAGVLGWGAPTGMPTGVRGGSCGGSLQLPVSSIALTCLYVGKSENKPGVGVGQLPALLGLPPSPEGAG